MERVKLDNKRILFNLLPAHVAQHFLMSNPRNMVSTWTCAAGPSGVCRMPECGVLGSSSEHPLSAPPATGAPVA